MENIVIGIEGTVGAGKTSICRELLKDIENSIILHGGEIYRAIVYGMMQTQIENTQNLDAFDIMKKLGIEIKLENNSSGKKEEYIYLDLLYNKLFNIIIDKNHEATINTDLFTLFETELGRTISPMEVEIIKEWLHDGNSEELIKEALKEAIYNNARNLKYIDRILFNWRTKGIKSKKDILEEKKNYRKTIKPKEPIYDYNWLEDE